MSILIVVDFPAPLGPMKASISPFSREKAMSATAVTTFSSVRHKARTLPRRPAAFCFTRNVLANPLTETTVSFIVPSLYQMGDRVAPVRLSLAGGNHPVGKIKKARCRSPRL